MNFKAMVAAPLAALLVMANAADLEPINNWGSGASGASSQAYAIGIDAKELYQGKRVASVKSMQASKVFDYGSATQTLSTYGYAGKRLRVSALIKAEGLDAWAGIWMGSAEANFQEFSGSVMPHGVGYVRPVGGAQAYWQPASVVIDLPMDAKFFQFGVALTGNGQVWATDFKFEEVSAEVPLTTTRVGIDVEKRAEARSKSKLSSPGAESGPTKDVPRNLDLK